MILPLVSQFFISSQGFTSHCFWWKIGLKGMLPCRKKMGYANAINLSGILCNLWTLRLSSGRHHRPICRSTYRPSINWLLIAILVNCWSTCQSICWSTLGPYGGRCISRLICWHVGQHSMACWPTCRPIWWNIARLFVDYMYQSTISDI